MKDDFYEPLGMRETSQLFGDTAPALMAKQYRMQGAEFVPANVPLYPFARGSGGTSSTAWDYAQFCQMYLNRGRYAGVNFLREGSVKMATSLTVKSPYQMPSPAELVQRGLRERWYYRRDARALGVDVGIGLGWVISADGSYSHAGLTGGYALVDPRQELIVIMLTHSNDARMLCHRDHRVF